MTSSFNKEDALEHLQLILVDPATNANKFWGAWLLSDGNLYAEYGRVNYAPRSHLYSYRTLGEARHKLQALVREKRAKGYTPAAVETVPVNTLDWSPFTRQAPRLQQKLAQISILAQAIARSTSIQFDPTQGIFHTALGVVSLSTLARARSALHQVEISLNQPSFEQRAGEYLSIIPLPVGMKLNVRTLLGTPDRIDSQHLCLSQLQQGLELIAQLRQELLQLSQDFERASQERAWWLSWGIAEESVDCQPLVEDVRCQHLQWQL